MPTDNIRAKHVLLAEDVYLLDDNGILYHLDKQGRKGYKDNHAQLVLPPPLRYEVLVHAHDDLTGGHLGTFKTYEKLRDRFYWRGMYKDVEHLVRSCVDCATRKRPRNNLKAPLLPIPVDGAFDRLAVDCLGPLPVTWLDHALRHDLVGQHGRLANELSVRSPTNVSDPVNTLPFADR